MNREEAFTGRRHDVEHIRIFGCLAFSHVPSKRRTKLDPTTHQGILVGYSEVLKAYRIYILPLSRVVVRRDVIFEEDRDFVRSLESRIGVEDDGESFIVVSKGAQPQILSTLVSGLIGSPCIASGSQSEHVQSDGAHNSEGAQTSGSQSVETSPKVVTLGQRDLIYPLTASRKRRPRWF
jgi:hypothetical protein